jgi:hypothetical protein
MNNAKDDAPQIVGPDCSMGNGGSYPQMFDYIRIWAVFFFEKDIILKTKIKLTNVASEYEYSLVVTKEIFRELLSLIPDWKKLCEKNEEKFYEAKKENKDTAPLNFYFYDNWNIYVSIYYATPTDYVFFLFYPLVTPSLTLVVKDTADRVKEILEVSKN